nr:hypothetical protein [Tanacetum cinerariifolium]
MSSASSVVTYIFVYTNSEPGRVFWGADEELLDGGPLQVIVYGYDGFPILPVASPSPDYIPSSKVPQTPPAPQDVDDHEPMFIHLYDPDFVPEPIYPEYIPLEDEHILPDEEQPLPPAGSPTAESPGYVAETKDRPVDYPMDRGDDGDDDDDDSSGDDADDKDEDEEEEEEHLASADFAVVIPTDELVSPPKGTEHRLLAMPTPSPSPLTSLSPPSLGERLARCTAPAALPLPPPLYMPPPIDRRDDILEIKMPPHKRLCLSTLGSRDTWIDPAETVPEIAPMTVRKVNTRVTEVAELHEHDTHDLYALLEDAQDSRTRSPFRALDSPGAGVRTQVLAPDTPDTATTAEYSHSDTAPAASSTDGRDSLSDGRHETRDGRHAVELLALLGQPMRAGQPGGDARFPNHQDAPRDADNHI